MQRTSEKQENSVSICNTYANFSTIIIIIMVTTTTTILLITTTTTLNKSVSIINNTDMSLYYYLSSLSSIFHGYISIYGTPSVL